MLKPNVRSGALLDLVLAAALPIAARGDDDGERRRRGRRSSALTIVESEAGNRLNVEISGDKKPGITEITFRNQGKKPHAAASASRSRPRQTASKGRS